MAQHQDLELFRATRPREQPDKREQILYDEIRERPEQVALLEHDSKRAEPSQAAVVEEPDEFTTLRAAERGTLPGGKL
jgi:hypothetical protein